MEMARLVADALQKALDRKQNTADGKAKAADAVEKEMQAQIDALTAANQQYAAKLAAAEKALADTKGNAVTGTGPRPLPPLRRPPRRGARSSRPTPPSPSRSRRPSSQRRFPR